MIFSICFSIQPSNLSAESRFILRRFIVGLFCFFNVTYQFCVSFGLLYFIWAWWSSSLFETMFYINRARNSSRSWSSSIRIYTLFSIHIRYRRWYAYRAKNWVIFGTRKVKQQEKNHWKKDPDDKLSMWFHQNRMGIYLLTAPQYILIRFPESKMFNCSSVRRTPFVVRRYILLFCCLFLSGTVGYLWSLTSTQRRHFYFYWLFIF